MDTFSDKHKALSRRDLLRYSAVGLGTLALSPVLNAIPTSDALGLEITHLTTSGFLPSNAIVLDKANYDQNPAVVELTDARILKEYSDSYSIHIEKNTAVVSFEYSYIGTYKGKSIGCLFTYSDFIFNYRCNTTVGAGPWHSENVVPYGTLTGIQHYKRLDYPDQILKGIDSCTVTFRFFDTDSHEIIELDPSSAFFSITMLDNDAGGYEGVVPGKNCANVYIADDAYISCGTLKSSVTTYENAFWGTNVVRNLQNAGMSQTEIKRRTGITMFFGGKNISVRLIDTVGCVYWQALFDPIFNTAPNSPLKQYTLTR